jgi:hypothetical protein
MTATPGWNYPEQVPLVAADQPLPARGIAAGLAAALLGAVLWAVVVALTHVRVGYMGLAIGALVGFSVQHFGRVRSTGYAALSAGLGVAGSLLGHLFATYNAESSVLGGSVVHAITSGRLSFDQIQTVFMKTTTPITWLLFALAGVSAFRVFASAAQKSATAPRYPAPMAYPPPAAAPARPFDG